MKPPSEPVTVLVFKDNLVARTFQVSLAWITRFGVLLATLCVTGIVSAILAAKYYYVARGADPVRVQELEQELSELRTSYQSALETQNAQATAAAPTSVPVPTSAPVPTVTVTVTPAPVAAGKTEMPPAQLFTDLPASAQPFRGEIPVAIHAPKLTWASSSGGRFLKVRFSIQYVLENRGSQQGRIVILARGPDALLAHPQGVFRKFGEGSLIAPERGEYFSVSRIREVKADFGPVSSTDTVQDVEVLLFNTNGELLLKQSFVPERSSAPARPEAQGAATDPEEEAEQ